MKPILSFMILLFLSATTHSQIVFKTDVKIDEFKDTSTLRAEWTLSENEDLLTVEFTASGNVEYVESEFTYMSGESDLGNHYTLWLGTDEEGNSVMFLPDRKMVILQSPDGESIIYHDRIMGLGI